MRIDGHGTNVTLYMHTSVGVKELVELNNSYINKLLVQNNHAQEYWDEWIKR